MAVMKLGYEPLSELKERKGKRMKMRRRRPGGSSGKKETWPQSDFLGGSITFSWLSGMD